MKYNLEILSPIHIGNGEKWFARGDYIIDNKKLHIINFDKFTLNLLTKNTQAFNDYIQEIKNNNTYSLTEFIKEYKLNYQEYIIKSFDINFDINTKEINQTIKTSGKPYIPGSSIKGAIRTAILWNFKLPEDGEEVIYNNEKDYIGDDLFTYRIGKDIIHYFRNLIITDSQPLNKDNLKIKEVNIISLKLNRKTSIPIISEFIEKGSSTIEIKLKGIKEEDGSDFLQKGSDDGLINGVNVYYKDRIESELKILKKNNINSSIIMFYNKLLEYSEEKNTIILRVGAYKNFYDQSISDLLKDKQLLEIQKKLPPKAKIIQSPFPSTRRIIDTNFVSGWIKLTKI